jgi:GT2 family glycosyltransferase
MTAGEPAVDVIVLDIDGGPMLLHCLDALELQSHRPRRVLIWDNGSSVPVTERLRERNSTIPLDVHRSDRNRGFTGGVNGAFRHVDAPFVAIVNNDAIVAPEWLELLVAELQRDATIAATQSVIVREDGKLDGAGIDISDGTFRQLGHGLPSSSLSALSEAWGVSATAALYRVSSLRAVAHGDDVLAADFFAYYEDADLCARLLAAGFRCSVVPVVAATHGGSRSASRLGRHALFLRTRNRYLVARRNRGVGNIRALIAEDMRQLARLVVRGRVLDAAAVARAMHAALGG